MDFGYGYGGTLFATHTDGRAAAPVTSAGTGRVGSAVRVIGGVGALEVSCRQNRARAIVTVGCVGDVVTRVTARGIETFDMRNPGVLYRVAWTPDPADAPWKRSAYFYDVRKPGGG